MEHLTEISDYVRLLLASEHFHLLLVQGPPGWGKSSLTRRALTNLGVEYRELGSYGTPLALYNCLVEFPDTLLLIDDCSNLLGNSHAMSLLNAATWPAADSGPRVVRWTSSTDLAAAPSADFRGKIIFLTNEVRDSAVSRAFQSRALSYRVEIAQNEISDLLRSAAACADRFPDTELALQVASFLAEQTSSRSHDSINLRALRAGYELAKVNPLGWRRLLLKALPTAKVDAKAVIQKLSLSDRNVEAQAGEFKRRTGLGRRRFFYLRKQLAQEFGTAARVPV